MTTFIKEWNRRKMTYVFITFSLIARFLYDLFIFIFSDGNKLLVVGILIFICFFATYSAWRFERTPDGFRRIFMDKAVQRTGRKLGYMALGAVLGILLINLLK